MIKIDPVLSNHIKLSERILEKAARKDPDDNNKDNDIVSISNEARKKRVMSQLIARIIMNDDQEKGS
jgi:hypothetical protein